MGRASLRKAGAFLAVIFFMIVTPLPAGADEVTDTISEALDQYREGDLAGAAGSLDYAAQLIRQQKGENLRSLLPDALPGWIAREAKSEAMGTAMLGGGVTAEREYTKASSSITIALITDSPLLQSIMMMFANPMFAASGGGKLETIAGQRAIVEYDSQDRSGKISIVVANRFLVTLEGREIERGDLSGYAAAIDYEKLASLP